MSVGCSRIDFAHAGLGGDAFAVPEDRLDSSRRNFSLLVLSAKKRKIERVLAFLGQHRPEALRDRLRRHRAAPWRCSPAGSASIGVFRYACGEYRGPAIMPNPPPFFATKSRTSCSCASENCRGSTSPKTHDVVIHHLFDAFGEARDRAIAFLAEAGIGAGQQAGDVDRLVADHLVLDVAIFPARISIDVKHVDLRIEHGDLNGRGCCPRRRSRRAA